MHSNCSDLDSSGRNGGVCVRASVQARYSSSHWERIPHCSRPHALPFGRLGQSWSSKSFVFEVSVALSSSLGSRARLFEIPHQSSQDGGGTVRNVHVIGWNALKLPL